MFWLHFLLTTAYFLTKTYCEQNPTAAAMKFSTKNCQIETTNISPTFLRNLYIVRKILTKDDIMSLVFVFNLNGRRTRNRDIVSTSAKPDDLSNARHIHRSPQTWKFDFEKKITLNVLQGIPLIVYLMKILQLKKHLLHRHKSHDHHHHYKETW